MANGTSGAPRGTRVALGGGAFTVTPGANGGVTITPNAQNNANQTFTGAGSGISDANTHTTYFTPADMAIVSSMPVLGHRVSQRSGLVQPVGYFNTGDYYNINTELRELGDGRRTRLTDKTKTVVDAMDRNMRPLNKAMKSTRWTDLRALANNLGMGRHASTQDVINKLAKNDVANVKYDYTSSSYKASSNTVAGTAGRYVRMDMHYSKGALVAFSPTRKEGEVVGARNVVQTYSNARIERTLMQNARQGNRYVDVLVVDVYVD